MEIEETQGYALWQAHEAYIRKLARSIARSFWKVEEDDVLQEIWVFLWQKEASLIEQDRSEAYIKTCIKNVAYNFALKERNKVLLETDHFYYHSDEVKDLLPAFFSSYDAWAEAFVPVGAESMTKNDNVEIMCDFRLAWEKLNDTQKEVLRRKYEDDEDFSEAKDRQALSRSTRRFVTLLNQSKNAQARHHQGPGSRKVITNAHASWETDRQVND